MLGIRDIITLKRKQNFERRSLSQKNMTIALFHDVEHFALNTASVPYIISIVYSTNVLCA